MLESILQAAEQAASSVSRREFLAQLGRGALIVVGALGAFLLSPTEAQAGGKAYYCCRIVCPEGRCSGFGCLGCSSSPCGGYDYRTGCHSGLVKMVANCNQCK